MNKSSDDWNKLKHLVDLSAENARLKAEVERLEAVIESYKDAGIRIFAMMDEERRNTSHLKAEVERLRASSFVTAVPVEEYEKLKAENERLRKAGDELSWAFAFAVSRDDGKESGLIKAWKSAKEGKQP